MNRYLRIALVATALLAVAGCSTEKVEILKSPCASLDDGPCGPKRVPAGNAQTGMSYQA